MFCPQCGQQQPSDEIRFCPRCGLSLSPHAALLAGRHASAAIPAGAATPARPWRRVGMRRAAKLMFFSVALIPIFLLLCVMADAGEPLLVPFVMFMAGLAWMVYSRLFGEDLVQTPRGAPGKDLGAGAGQPALGPQQFVPASFLNRQRTHTAEMASPPTVTENTTKLLDKDA